MRVAVTGGAASWAVTCWPACAVTATTCGTWTGRGERDEGFVRVDLTDAAQVMDVLAGLDDRYAGLDAVVHLAAIPVPASRSEVGACGGVDSESHGERWP